MDEFCVIVYPDAQGQVVGRCITMTTLSKAYPMVGEFTFATKSTIYAWHGTRDIISHINMMFFCIDLAIDDSDGQGTVWKLLSEFEEEQNESDIRKFFEDLSNYVTTISAERLREKYTKGGS